MPRLLHSFLVFVAALGALTAGELSRVSSGVPIEFKRQLHEQINRDRLLAQRQPVQFSPELSAAADAHCREMLEHGYVSHWNRAGWRPYLRYAQAGVTDYTAENVWGLQHSDFDPSPEHLLETMFAAHRSFMAEVPPNDGHRRSILDSNHTHVGIGVAYGPLGMRLIEVFGGRYAELEPLPAQTRLRDSITLRGRVLPGVSLLGIAVFYEPLPRPMSLLELAATSSYSLPEEERTFYTMSSNRLPGPADSYRIQQLPGGRFLFPVSFWKGRPGVYTVGVWVTRDGQNGFLGALTATFVTE